MEYVVVGILTGYREGEEAIQDLELAGITGGQVQLITDTDDDARTIDTPGEKSTDPPKKNPSWLARLFGQGARSRPFAPIPATSRITSATRNFTPRTSSKAERSSSCALPPKRPQTAPPKFSATMVPEPQGKKTAPSSVASARISKKQSSTPNCDFDFAGGPSFAFRSKGWEFSAVKCQRLSFRSANEAHFPFLSFCFINHSQVLFSGSHR